MGGLEPQIARQQKRLAERALSCLAVSWNSKENAASYKKNTAETRLLTNPWQISGDHFLQESAAPD
jgi:hypothetical protein